MKDDSSPSRSSRAAKEVMLSCFWNVSKESKVDRIGIKRADRELRVSHATDLVAHSIEPVLYCLPGFLQNVVQTVA